MTRPLLLASIRARMTAAFSAAIGLLLLLTGTGLTLYSHHAAMLEQSDLLHAATRKLRRDLMGNRYAEPTARPGTIFPSELRELIADERDLSDEDFAIMVVDDSGKTLQKSQGRLPRWPRSGPDDMTDGWRVVSVTLAPDTNVVIGLPWNRIGAGLRHQALILSILGITLWVAASGGAWLLVGRTLRPIEALSQQASIAAADDLRVRLSPSSQDAEIVNLVQTLNGLLARIADTAASRGRFYAAASHELRTPLQALSGHLELALTRPRSEGEYRAVVQEARAQTQRLTSLVRDLLRLNQIEAGAGVQSTPREQIPIGAVCEQALRQMQALIDEKGLRIENRVSQDIDIVAVPTHMEMLTRNLIENAVKYASEGGVVRVAAFMASSEGGEATPPRLEVFNECPPLPSWDEHKLFEPFYRPDAARSAKTGGNGLGLAICNAIARANNWTLSLRQTDRGVQASVVFSGA